MRNSEPVGRTREAALGEGLRNLCRSAPTDCWLLNLKNAVEDNEKSLTAKADALESNLSQRRSAYPSSLDLPRRHDDDARVLLIDHFPEIGYGVGQAALRRYVGLAFPHATQFVDIGLRSKRPRE